MRKKLFEGPKRFPHVGQDNANARVDMGFTSLPGGLNWKTVCNILALEIIYIAEGVEVCIADLVPEVPSYSGPAASWGWNSHES